MGLVVTGSPLRLAMRHPGVVIILALAVLTLLTRSNE
jgi:hypothetical protein